MHLTAQLTPRALPLSDQRVAVTNKQETISRSSRIAFRA